MKSQSISAPNSNRLLSSSLTRIAICLSLVALIGVPLFSSSSASSSDSGFGDPVVIGQPLAAANKQLWVSSGMGLKAGAAKSMFPLVMPQGPAVETIEVFQSDCTTPATTFNLGETVCAKFTNAPTFASFALRRVTWVNTAGLIVQDEEVLTSSQDFTFNIPNTAVAPDGTDRRGSWSVNSISTADASVHVGVSFEVRDPANAAANLSLYESNLNGDSDVAAGQAVTYNVLVVNHGPDAATGVTLTKPLPELVDSVSPPPTFLSRTQISGPAFTCGSDTSCQAASFPAGSVAEFVFTYTVVSGTPDHTVIRDFSTVESGTIDPKPTDNDSVAFTTVLGAAGPATCVLTCPANVVVTANAISGGNPGAFVNTAAAAIQSGDCGSISNTPQSGSFFTVGTHNVVSISESGPTCTFTVTVIDSAPPTISCPPNITVTAATGATEADVTVGAPTTTPATGVTVTGVRSDGTPATYDEFGNVLTPAVAVPLDDPYPVGTTGILWTVTDGVGRRQSCTQSITVQSVERATLTISCPANITTSAPSGTCEGTVTLGSPTTTPSDNQVTVVGLRSDGQALGDPYPAGTTQVTWTATDAVNDSVATCTQTVTVSGTDNVAPTLTVPGAVSATTASCSALLDDELGVATAEDNCTPSVNVVRTGVPVNFVFPTGTTVITYTATDASGNTATGTQQVTVVENTPPTINAPASLLTLNTGGVGGTSCGTFVGDATLGSATANDNCPGVTVARTGVPAGNNFPVGDTIITYTATDRSGNTAQATQTIRVADNTSPVVTPPGAVTLLTGPGASSCSVTVANLDGTFGTGSATDNCPGVGAVSRSGVPPGSVFPVGNTTLTYSATDAHGNTGSATQVVTVVDNTLPVVTAPGPVTLHTGAGATSCSVTVANLDGTFGTGSATDNCPGVGAVSRSGVPSGSVFPVGNTTLTYSATDAHGNTGSATQVVTVVDNTQPIISCPANITIEPTCPTGAIGTYATPTATDNCGVQSVNRNAGSLASGSVFPIGTSTVTHTATDIYGNQSSCSFTVTVLTPQAVIQNLITSVNASPLTGTQKNGLLAKLNAALTAINGGGGNACAKLSDFVNSVGTLISHGDISAAVGNAWISSANHVRNTIGCTNLGCS